MEILKKKEFKKLLDDNPTKKYVFFEWVPRIFISDFHISSGDPKGPDFGAAILSGDPSEDFIFSYDWAINEYTDDDMFAVLSDDEVKEIINIFAETLKNG